ncbi:hypothetical protein Dsin_018520 [Dipteronia sinensis]|uniref:Retrotransposon gag domain-containing protein n=1 Tax=Dipteronia sinensis TaxID=43782 RepID=A0AAE0A6B2_9ROSI|nr:hypothetical protein Dsin_018520 [Dipteronia sinensis]
MDRKCERFFLIHHVPSDQKVLMASIHFEKKAEAWFKSFYALREGVGWNEFTEALLERFVDVGHEDIVGELYRLRQNITVAEYQERFEEIQRRLLAKNLRLKDEFLIASFVSGLKREIKHDVKKFNPWPDLKTAIQIARLQEASLEAKKYKPWPAKRQTNYYPNTYQNPPPHKINNQYIPPDLTYPSRKNIEPIPIKKLTPIEMKVRRDKGLCYNCNETYTFVHQYAKKQFYMLCGEEEGGEFENEETDEPKEEAVVENDEEITFSHHALTWSMGMQAIQLRGKVKNGEITILVDSGSTHNFLDPETAKFAGVNVKNIYILWVTV